jgi:DNA replication and repair protein RecF
VYIRNIRVNGYRNLKNQTIELDTGINLFIGDNGQGKTNTLEAIHLLATLRSFRSTQIRDIICHEGQKAEISGSVISRDVPLELKISITQDGRRLWMGQRSVSIVSDYLGSLKVVAFTPDDLAMVKGGPSIRRKFMDRVVFLFKPEHLKTVRDFNTALKARNKLLKSKQAVDRQVIDSFSQTLAIHGAQVTKARKDIIEKILEPASKILSHLDDGQERLGLYFKPGWPANESVSADCLLDNLRSGLDQDIRRYKTTRGPQLDDFEILLDNESARRFASQGQQRSCALALLLAIIKQAVEESGQRPVILLDDVSSELDSKRRKQLFEQVIGLGNQVLVTTTDKDLVKDLSCKTQRKFIVSDGMIEAS